MLRSGAPAFRFPAFVGPQFVYDRPIVDRTFRQWVGPEHGTQDRCGAQAAAEAVHQEGELARLFKATSGKQFPLPAFEGRGENRLNANPANLPRECNLL